MKKRVLIISTSMRKGGNCYIEDKIGLADALGNGSIKVSFRMASRDKYVD